MRRIVDLRVLGRCDHVICSLCSVNAPMVPHSDGECLRTLLYKCSVFQARLVAPTSAVSPSLSSTKSRINAFATNSTKIFSRTKTLVKSSNFTKATSVDPPCPAPISAPAPTPPMFRRLPPTPKLSQVHPIHPLQAVIPHVVPLQQHPLHPAPVQLCMEIIINFPDSHFI